MRLAPFQRKLAAYAAAPENNYLLLRFVAALMVIYGHSYAITRLPGRHDLLQSLLRFTYAGDVGVNIFFVISGFLVTASYLNRRAWGDFMKSRCLRIFPGLFVCLLATVFLLGPVVSTLGPVRYLTDPGLYTQFISNLTLVSPHFRLPGVFEHLPQEGVNGSLWTLPLEFGLYVLLGFFGLAGLLFCRRAYLPFMVCLCLGALLLGLRVHVLPNQGDYVRLCLLFAVGSTLRVYSDRVPLHWVFVAVLALPALIAFHTAAFPFLFTAWLVYSVMWAAYVPNLHLFNRLGDYSYGLYIYAFPIQQTLRQYFVDIGPLQLFAAASVLTLLCAMLSWHLIEEPALCLKGVSFREMGRHLLRRRSAAAAPPEQ